MSTRRQFLRATLYGMSLGHFSSKAAGIEDRVRSVMLGKTRIQLETHGSDQAEIVFVNLHENEKTSVHAVRDLIAPSLHRIIKLHFEQQRLINFSLNGMRFTFDPNRIFSHAGIKRTLHYYGHYTPEAHEAVSRLREAILGEIRPERTRLLVALHNNAGSGYSIDDYLDRGPYASETLAVHPHPQKNSSDFFLVTQRAVFDAMKSSGFGVVLQNTNVQDDGSLSFYFRDASLVYINVEARHGHLREQRRMLEFLLERYPVLTSTLKR